MSIVAWHYDTALYTSGAAVLGVTATFFNAPNGPDAASPHLEFSVTPYSLIPQTLGLPWDPTVCSAAHIELGVTRWEGGGWGELSYFCSRDLTNLGT
jgi:hypothetical protein